MQLHTYLNYGGNCEHAFRFYEEHLGGKITMLMRPSHAASRSDVNRASSSASTALALRDVR